MLSISSAGTVHAASLIERRRLYDQAKAALAKGNSAPYITSRSALHDYPLEPYLTCDELTHRLESVSSEGVEYFLAKRSDLPQIDWLGLHQLRLLADRGDWKTFVSYYDPKLNFAELDCLYDQYQLGHGQKAEGYAASEHLWLVNKSQPAACDALFGPQQGEGQLAEGKVWRRLKLAAGARNYSLAPHLAQRLPTLDNQGTLMIDMTQDPTQPSQAGRFSQHNYTTANVVDLGLRRLARQDPERALSPLNYYSSALPFSNDEKVAIAREIGLNLIKRFNPRALSLITRYDPSPHDNTVTEQHVRLLLHLGRQDEAYVLTRKLPQDLITTNYWCYWQVHSLQLTQPNSKGPVALYQKLTGERDPYGFLAVDRLNVPYKLSDHPTHIDPHILRRVRNAASARRAVEFFNHSEAINARREWYHAARLFDCNELTVRARLIYDMQRYFSVIRSTSQAQCWDDLDIRFPMTYHAIPIRETKNHGLHSSQTLAITWQESAFVSDARSGVSTTGLMRLIPGTAKETSHEFGTPLASTQQLIVPNVNIRLGTAYLNQVHSQFNGNRMLTSAAYNASPGHIHQWLKDTRHLALDAWIGTIPLDETRQYM